MRKESFCGAFVCCPQDALPNATLSNEATRLLSYLHTWFQAHCLSIGAMQLTLNNFPCVAYLLLKKKFYCFSNLVHPGCNFAQTPIRFSSFVPRGFLLHCSHPFLAIMLPYNLFFEYSAKHVYKFYTVPMRVFQRDSL